MRAEADARQSTPTAATVGVVLSPPKDCEVAVGVNGSSPFAPFAVSVSRGADETLVAPRGELDLAAADELAQAVTDLWSAGADRILIDLQPLDFIDSSGLRTLLALREAALRDRRELALRAGPPAVQRIFDLTGTSGLFRWRSR